MRTQEAGTLVAASGLVTVSDYFSFVGADSQGYVAFAIDNNRGRDGSAYQGEHFYAVLHVLSQAHYTRITQVPAVIQFDGIWLRLQLPTGTVKTDRRRRRRKPRKGKRMAPV